MKEIIEFQYDRLKNDATLISLMTNPPIINPPQVRFVESLKDSDFPFIIVKCEQDTVEPWGIYRGTVDFHIWTYGPSAKQGVDIRDRVFALFERLYYPTIDNVLGVRYRFLSQHWVPETDNRVHHLIMRFGVRWVARGDIQVILDREGV